MRISLVGILCALVSGISISCRKDSPSPISKSVPLPIQKPEARPILKPDTAAISPSVERAIPVITKNGIGEVKLGMTLTELKNLFPLAKFESQEGGDGVTWFYFSTDAGDTMSLYVGDWDSSASVMWNRGIEIIEIFSTLYVTESGVRVGDLISDVEKKIGKVVSISESEIESGQYIEFEKQPVGIGFMLDYSGIFPEGSRVTRKYAEAAKIFAISTSLYP